MRTGGALLLEGVEEAVDVLLQPLLLRAVVRAGNGRLLLRLGGADVDFDPAFRLLLCTTLPNPHILPELAIHLTLVNFTVTRRGLEEQLLGGVVSLERPAVERRRGALIVSLGNDKRQLKQLEDRILRLLSESAGNVLDDEALVGALGAAKTTAAIIGERVLESEATARDINRLRECYRPVAARGSLAYFAVADLAGLDFMYQFSLDYFVHLFDATVASSGSGSAAGGSLDAAAFERTGSGGGGGGGGGGYDDGMDGGGGGGQAADDWAGGGGGGGGGGGAAGGAAAGGVGAAQGQAHQSARAAPPAAALLAGLVEATTAAVFSNVCRGLFDRHKLVFAFLLAAGVRAERGDLSQAELLLLLRGPSAVLEPGGGGGSGGGSVRRGSAMPLDSATAHMQVRRPI